MTTPDVKQRVQDFYNRVGWQVEDDGHYQNARYEDLRPVAAEYIRRCHQRVMRHLSADGEYLLDAGSGPVQYPEYVAYSRGYRYRVCADISIVALQEARARLGEHGLYVVADVANLPFASDPFDGVVSLHTLHHLPLEEQTKAYDELYRVLKPGHTAVVVNGWTDSPLMRRADRWVSLAERGGNRLAKWRGKAQPATAAVKSAAPSKRADTGTFIRKQDAAWLQEQLGGRIRYAIFPWRSVSVRFLRALVHSALGGRFALRVLFGLEDRFPRWFGEKGQYPLIVLYKDAA